MDYDHKDRGEYSLGEPAAALYGRLKTKRDAVLSTAREMATITIPSLFPPEGYQSGDQIGENNQSVGAQCINTLASKLMYVAFPPNRPAMRFELEEYKLKKENDGLSEDDKQVLLSKLNVALASLEVTHKRRMEATRVRMAYVTYMKQLEAGGNAAWEHEKIGDPVVHRMDTYVVKRNKRGEQLFVILEETLLLEDLPKEFADRMREERKIDFEGKAPWECEITTHRVCKTVGSKDAPRYIEWSEYEGEIIPGSKEDQDDLPQIYAGWLIPQYGEDWGRSYAEEYRGDHYIVENGYAALQDGMAAAAWTLFGVKPGGSTKLADLIKARNLKWVTGDLVNDVTVLRVDKGSDFAFVDNTTAKAERRLARAYLMVSSVQRDAERVTAEEWVQLTGELDEAMGGLHSVIAQTIQRHVVMKFLALHKKEEPDLPDFEKIAGADVVRTEIVTGVDALSRSHEGASLRRLRRALVEDLGPEGAARVMSDIEYARRLAASEGVQTAGLILEDKDIQANDQSKLQTGIAAQAAPGVIEKVAGTMAEGGKEALLQQQAQQNGVMPNGN
ncbi:portal protein [Aestuariivirga sp. YIM B02566]|uniref:Uncharacterized protein n=1 Tax=Taklimakanibacter albus TaxID=2800327 RepID=A0ACC5RFZ0_9HYPH|nr:portal protein [Aestuariivirga sp. YIM B02566]MBK1871565.1 hypothetical protein [Aestuariivirga sp. YIM B02566]